MTETISREIVPASYEIARLSPVFAPFSHVFTGESGPFAALSGDIGLYRTESREWPIPGDGAGVKGGLTKFKGF